MLVQTNTNDFEGIELNQLLNKCGGIYLKLKKKKLMENNELLVKYKELLSLIENKKNEFSEADVSVFNIAKGRNFKNEIIVYGRAVNGWCNFMKEELLANFDTIESNILNDNLDWVINLFHNPVDDWKPYRSAFWRLIKSLASDIYSNNEYEVLNEIAWSNLYKISKAAEGNPSQRLMNVQLGMVKDILKLELDIYKPNVAIFLTSLGWANPLLKDLGIEILEKNQEFKFVELVAKYNNTIIIVGQHPQGKPEGEHKNEILKGIQNAKEHFGY